jgi:hypothetical protein
MCLTVILLAVGFFVALYAFGYGAKLASRYYQRQKYGAVDEEVVVAWQNRVVLVGIVIGLVNLYHMISFSAAPH